MAGPLPCLLLVVVVAVVTPILGHVIKVDHVLADESEGGRVVSLHYWHKFRPFMDKLDTADFNDRTHLLTSPDTSAFLVPPELLTALSAHLNDSRWLSQLRTEYGQYGGRDMSVMVDTLRELGEVAAEHQESISLEVLHQLLWHSLLRPSSQPALASRLSDALHLFFDTPLAALLARAEPGLFEDFLLDVLEFDWMPVEEVLDDTVSYHQFLADLPYEADSGPPRAPRQPDPEGPAAAEGSLGDRGALPAAAGRHKEWTSVAPHGSMEDSHWDRVDVDWDGEEGEHVFDIFGEGWSDGTGRREREADHGSARGGEDHAMSDVAESDGVGEVAFMSHEFINPGGNFDSWHEHWTKKYGIADMADFVEPLVSREKGSAGERHLPVEASSEQNDAEHKDIEDSGIDDNEHHDVEYGKGDDASEEVEETSEEVQHSSEEVSEPEIGEDHGSVHILRHKKHAHHQNHEHADPGHAEHHRRNPSGHRESSEHHGGISMHYQMASIAGDDESGNEMANFHTLLEHSPPAGEYEEEAEHAEAVDSY